MALSQAINQYLDGLKKENLLRRCQLREDVPLACPRFDSNDYLSLSIDSHMKQAYAQAYDQYPSGSGASIVLSGYHPNHQALERRFAEFLEVDKCLLFSSGYAANLAIISLLERIQARCIIDKKIHASIYDGLSMGHQSFSRFVHNDVTDLERKLKQSSKHAAVMTEGIFSMTGQVAPLADISLLCQNYGAELIVDEAHSFGVLGDEGRGAVQQAALRQNQVPLRMISFGKALAAQGALVAGKEEWIEALLQAGRSIIYSTAISPALSTGVLSSLDKLSAAEDRRVKLRQLIVLFREYRDSSPLTFSDSSTAIQQLTLGSSTLALAYAEQLKKRGIYCSAIRKPTVDSQSTGLRIILNYQHEPEHIHLLFQELNTLYEQKF